MTAVCFFCALLGLASGFQVFWNVPTKQCRANFNMDFVSLLRTFKILVNDGDKFQGENITIFYEAQLGLYPRILKTHKEENGGIPQKGNLAQHLRKAAKDLQKTIPSNNFRGLGVIDWEAWRPTWEFNWQPLKIYQVKSIELAKELNPTKSDEEIAEIAKQQWQSSARSYMLETLRLVKQLRPEASWCYYLFPDCYNYVGKKPMDFQCSKQIKSGNDKIQWLWDESTAICPSIYVYRNQLQRYTLEERSWRDNGKLKEAVRVASPKAQIFPYINYFDDELLPKEEIWRMLAQAAAAGANGAVIWGSSASVASEDLCKNLKEYIKHILGPAAEKVAWNSNLCSEQICNSQGTCSWPDDDSVVAWKLFLDKNSSKFYAGNVTCRCSEKYSGRYCEKKI